MILLLSALLEEPRAEVALPPISYLLRGDEVVRRRPPGRIVARAAEIRGGEVFVRTAGADPVGPGAAGWIEVWFDEGRKVLAIGLGDARPVSLVPPRGAFVFLTADGVRLAEGRAAIKGNVVRARLPERVLRGAVASEIFTRYVPRDLLGRTRVPPAHSAPSHLRLGGSDAITSLSPNLATVAALRRLAEDDRAGIPRPGRRPPPR